MLAVVITALASVAPLAVQDSTARVDSALTAPPAPPAPTPEQIRYTQGLRTVSRGVAQLRDGVDRVTRTQLTRDTLRQKLAGRRLGGLCTTARSFIASGRPRMQPTAYTDSMLLVARQLVVRIDSVFKFLPTCETTAGKTPVPVAADLLKRLRAYDTALVTFRTKLAPPKPDSVKTPSQQ
jgi:hypothetical protein